jgi:hypothetical protein
MSDTKITGTLPSTVYPLPSDAGGSPVRNTEGPNRQVNSLVVSVERRYDSDVEGQPRRPNDPQPPGSNSTVLDPAVLIPLVMGVLNQLEESQISAFSKELQEAQPRYEKTMNVMIAKIEEQARKQAEIQKKQKDNQIASDVQLGLGAAMTVFGILATILTAGAASPLIAVGMAIGATLTSLDIVNRGLQAGNVMYDDPLDKTGRKKNPLDISIGGLVKMAVEKHAATDPGFYPDEIKRKGPAAMEKYRNEVVMGVSIFISIVIAGSTVALSVGGIVSLKNAAKAAKDGVEIAKDLTKSVSKLGQFAQDNAAKIQMITQVAEVGADVVNLGASGYQNISGLLMADTKFTSVLAGAEATRLQVAMELITGNINTIQSTSKNISQSINQSKQMLIETQNNTISSESKILAQI